MSSTRSTISSPSEIPEVFSEQMPENDWFGDGIWGDADGNGGGDVDFDERTWTTVPFSVTKLGMQWFGHSVSARNKAMGGQ